MSKIRPLILLALLICSQYTIHAQRLYLECFGTNTNESAIIDSLDYKKTFKTYNALENEVLKLKHQLVLKGFIETKQLELTKQNDSSYHAYFSLKNKYKFIELKNTSILDKQLLQQTGFLTDQNTLKIPIHKVELTLEYINNILANQGDPFTSLKIDTITKKDNTTLTGNLIVSKSKIRTIDNIILKGYEKFPRSYIKRYLKIKRNTPFSLDNIKEKSKALNNLVFANQIREPEILFTKDSTILYMYLEKTKSNTFDGFLGFGTNESNNRIEFDGYLNLNLTNNLNYGESLKLLYRSDENDQQTFDLELNAPYLFKTPLGLNLNLTIFKRDTSFATVTQDIKLNYQINSNQSLSGGITSTNSTDLRDTPSVLIQDYTSNQFTVNYQYKQLQTFNQLFPLRFSLNLSAGIGSRRYANIQDKQTQIYINTFNIFNLNQKNSIFTRLTGTYLISNSYLENELPRFGGINSIRGFEENSLIGNLYAVANTEYRYTINKNLYIHSVIDAAYFENQITNQKEKLFGIGFGFGLITKAGLFKFNYTSGKRENSTFKLSDSKIHLSLTTQF